jgi:hypothetical protein
VCFLALPLASHPLAIGVLLSLKVFMLLIFWDAWRSPPTTEPAEDCMWCLRNEDT